MRIVPVRQATQCHRHSPGAGRHTDLVSASLPAAALDRASGVILGQACGDALGVPYEFGCRALEPLPRMLGGGLGGYAPGEWSDDTQMAFCIARVSSTGASLASSDALDAIAEGFLDWYAASPPDVGILTRAVLGSMSGTRGPGAGARLQHAAQAYFERTGRAAANGALMRTSVVALTRLLDRPATAAAATQVARLTHADPLAAESCVLWSEAIRVAVLDGRIAVRSGLDLIDDSRRPQWALWLDQACAATDPSIFPDNGFTVTALQAALCAITATASDDPEAHVVGALSLAVNAGHDTDTVAAIAGGLLGAAYGPSAFPEAWRAAVHGWPGPPGRADADDLVALTLATARAGC